jgi:hypothetical protein
MGKSRWLDDQEVQIIPKGGYGLLFPRVGTVSINTVQVMANINRAELYTTENKGVEKD